MGLILPPAGRVAKSMWQMFGGCAVVAILPLGNGPSSRPMVLSRRTSTAHVVPDPAQAPVVTQGSGHREAGAVFQFGGGVPDNGHEPAAGFTSVSAQPGAQGLVRLLPARRVQRNLRPPELLHVASGRESGCVANTAGPLGRTSAAATATLDGGQPRRIDRCSTPAKVAVTRYRYRGAVIPIPWQVAA